MPGKVVSMNGFTTKNWEEKIVSGTEGSGPRVAYAHATIAYEGVIEGTSVCDLLLYYGGLAALTGSGTVAGTMGEDKVDYTFEYTF